MAILTLENGDIYTQLEDIAPFLAKLKVQLNHWPLDQARADLLSQESLEPQEKEELLKSIDFYFEQLTRDLGYQSRDLIVLYPSLPGLSVLLEKFALCHTHADDEVRYIIDGEGVFGFVFPDASQGELTVQAGEYINVPKFTEHWFHLSDSNKVKAVRYFTNTEGWSPIYTNTVIRFPQLISK